MSESNVPTAKSPTKPPRWLAVLTILAEYFDKPAVMESGTVRQLYQRTLETMTPEQLETCLSRSIAELRFMPKVAELLELAGTSQRLLVTGAKDELTLEAECGWNRLVTSGLDWQHNVLWKPPAMPDAGDYATRTCGGYEAIFNKILANMDGTEAPDATAVHFVRQNWIDAYMRYQDTDGLKALPRAEAQRLLAGVTGLLE